MTVEKMSYKDMAKIFSEHNKAKNGKELVGIIVFHEKCFKSLYKDLKYRSYRVSSKSNAWNGDALNDMVTAYCIGDTNDVMAFNIMPKIKVEYCYIIY